jgi:hypothetical protein
MPYVAIIVLVAAYLLGRDYILGILPASLSSLAGPTRNDVRRAVRAQAIAFGLPPDYLDAIAYVESTWRLDAVNDAGGVSTDGDPRDAARGGAYGPLGMTQTTARALGYEGPMSAFTEDLYTAAYWGALNLSQGTPGTFADACAYQNAGVTRFDKLGPGHPTRTDYWPKAVAALERVISNPVSEV